MKRLIAILSLLLPIPISAQLGSGLLAPNRQIDWSQAGAGTIPARSTVCTTVPAGASMATIQAAVAACPAGQTVLLSAGTYTTSSSLILTTSNVTLRGAGPKSTILKFTGTSTNCMGIGPTTICLWNGDSGTLNSVANVCNLSSGYSQGSTTLVFGSCPTGSISNLHVGSIIKMNQLDDPTDTGNAYFCGNTICSQQGDSGNVTTGRSQIQLFTVTGISGSNVSVSPAVYAPQWSAGKSPQAGFSSSLPMTGFGLENLTVDTTSLTTGAAMIQFVWATKSWVKNVSLINNTGSGDSMHKHVWVGASSHITVRDSYLYGASPTSEGYGVDFWESSDGLAENNICQHMPTCEIMEGGEGNVFGYHYAVDNFYNGGNFCGGGGTSPCSPNWQQCDQFHHNAGDYYNLWEGGIGICHTEDSIHGTAFANTVFRNALSGFDPAQTPSGPGGVGSPVPKSNNLLTINNMANARYQNYVANVLGWGKPATSYQYVMTSSGDCGPGTPGSGGSPPLVYAMDDSGQVVSAAPCYTAYTVVNDVVANARPSASSMECGNWDAVTAGVHSCQTANSASTYPGLASPSSSYASYPSLYLSSQPSWWVFPSGSVAPWPGIGPEVTGGNISGTSGHAWLNPAANCYLNVLGGGTSGSTGSLQSSFDAATCYPAAVGGVSLTVTATNGTATGLNCSTGTYTSGATVGACTFTPNAGYTFTSVTGTGSTVCTTSPCGPFTLTATSTITASFTLIPTVATPTFSPTSLSSAGRVTIASVTSGAKIFYTVDGSTPTASSAVYTHPLYATKAQTLKAFATKIGFIDSAVASQAFSPAAAKTRFSLTPTSSSSSPVPYPQDLRSCCGSNVAAMNSALGTTNFTVLHNWIAQATANGSTYTYTIQGFPTWMTGLGTVESAPPSDLHTATVCAATGTTTTDCSMKSFVIALMKDRTGLSSQPASPTTCSHLDFLEIINEFNTDSPSGSSTGWTGTYSDLATMANDISGVVHAWCSNTVVTGGSASAVVGFHANSENGHYDIALETLLADWAGISNASLPDAISAHLYASRIPVTPMPMPTTLASNSDSTCTSGNTPNVSCYIAVKDQVTQLNTSATLQNAAIVAWAKYLPIYSTEGGFGEVAQLGGSSTTTIGASYVAESMMAIAVQNPIEHLFYAADDATWGCYWNCGSGTSAWLFAFNQMSSWLNGHTITGALVSSAITGGTKWSIQLDSGAAELDFCDAWLASCTASTSFTAVTTLGNATSATGGSVTLTQEPSLLFNTAQVATPTFSPVAGTYSSAQTVTISTSTSGATLYYTLDGSTPTTSSTPYTTPIVIPVTTTIKALGVKAGLTNSAIGTALYTITPATTVNVILAGTVPISGTVNVE